MSARVTAFWTVLAVTAVFPEAVLTALVLVGAAALAALLITVACLPLILDLPSLNAAGALARYAPPVPDGDHWTDHYCPDCGLDLHSWSHDDCEPDDPDG